MLGGSRSVRKSSALALISIVLAIWLWPPPSHQPTPPDPDSKYLVGAHYYSWFPEAFDNGYLRARLNPPQRPALGQYSCWEVEVIEQQIEWASRHGIDFFSLVYWPERSPEDLRLDMFLQASNLADTQFCLRYDTQALSPPGEGGTVFDPLTTERFLKDIEEIGRLYMTHPQYLKIGGRPVLLLYSSHSNEGEYAAALNQARSILRELDHDVFLVGDEAVWCSPQELERPVAASQIERFDPFDALTLSSPCQPSRLPQGGFGAASTLLEDLAKLTERYKQATQLPLLPTVFPGFNDRAIHPQADHIVIPRLWKKGASPGSFLQTLLADFALPEVDQRAPLILVDSWNDWNRDTAVEPSTPIGQTPITDEGLTDGFPYPGYGVECLEAIREEVVAIRGEVWNSKEAVPGVTVTAWRGNAMVARTRTDSRGYYQLSRLNLSRGDYELSVENSRRPVSVESHRSVEVNLEVDYERPKRVPELELAPRFPALSRELIQTESAFPGRKITGSDGLKYFVDPLDPRRLPADVLAALKRSDTALDLAGHGLASLQLARRFKTAYVLEAQLPSYRELKANAALNQLSNLKQLPYTAANQSGLSPDRSREQRTVDSLGLSELDLIYLKTQDLHLLSGAQHTLEHSRPELLIDGGELGDEEQQRLLALNYRVSQQWKGLNLAEPLDPQFLLATADDLTFPDSGFTAPEKAEGEIFVWSNGERAHLEIPAPLEGPLRLGFCARTLPEIAPLSVSVSWNGHKLPPLKLHQEWRVQEILIPTGVPILPVNRVDFRFPRTHQPTRDNRALGGSFKKIWVTSEG